MYRSCYSGLGFDSETGSYTSTASSILLDTIPRLTVLRPLHGRMANPSLAKRTGFARETGSRACPSVAIQAYAGMGRCTRAPRHGQRTTGRDARCQHQRKHWRAKRLPQQRQCVLVACVKCAQRARETAHGTRSAKRAPLGAQRLAESHGRCDRAEDEAT